MLIINGIVIIIDKMIFLFNINSPIVCLFFTDLILT